MLAGGSLLALALFYRGFVAMVLDLVLRVGGGAEGAEPRYPVRGFFEIAFERTRAFFGWVYPLLAAIGLGALWTPITWAWLGTYLVLLLGRAKLPDVFLHGHETLFLTPLVCLAAGAVLGRFWDRGRWQRWLSVGLLGLLTVEGLASQWQAVTAQLLPP
jgi:hypothetical protein